MSTNVDRQNTTFDQTAARNRLIPWKEFSTQKEPSLNKHKSKNPL